MVQTVTVRLLLPSRDFLMSLSGVTAVTVWADVREVVEESGFLISLGIAMFLLASAFAKNAFASKKRFN